MASKPPMIDPRHLDMLAQAHGFPDFATYQAWQHHINNSVHSPADYNIQQGQQEQPQSIGNWFSMLIHDPQQAISRLLPQSSGIQLAADALNKVNKK